MLKNIDAFIVDIQDVGARLYTYVWTLKLCMEVCSEAGIPVWVLDRPNPVAGLSYDGPVLKKEFFTFVGGACIPLCHRMTPAEIAIWCREKYIETCDLNIVRLENWGRELMFNETGLPWVIPSPNMPGLNTAIVYPGMVLLEAMNLSEGRGTTIPFELSGAPYVKSVELFKNLTARNIPGCRFRVHNFIPTFNKYTGEYCSGIQVHVTDIKRYRPVATAAEMIEAIIQTSEPSAVIFNNPPYEYEYGLMPFDILSGDSSLRHTLESGASLSQEFEKWQEETESFRKEFSRISLYGNC
jgi:uncharacterized protein YbbC (DUF1343 family)